MPAALEDLTGKEIPVSLLEKSADLRGKGGLMVLRQMFDELPQLLQRNEEILREFPFFTWVLGIFTRSEGRLGRYEVFHPNSYTENRCFLIP